MSTDHDFDHGPDGPPSTPQERQEVWDLLAAAVTLQGRLAGFCAAGGLPPCRDRIPPVNLATLARVLEDIRATATKVLTDPGWVDAHSHNPPGHGRKKVAGRR